MDGRIYGDFDLNNVLCNPQGRCISLVDPGMPERSYECPAAPRRWYPATRDLAYILFDVATSIRSSLLKPALRRKQWQLVQCLLTAAMNKLQTSEARVSFLEEVRACCQVHLQRIDTTLSFRGLRHLLVRQAAALRIRMLLRQLAPASQDVQKPQEIALATSGSGTS